MRFYNLHLNQRRMCTMFFFSSFFLDLYVEIIIQVPGYVVWSCSSTQIQEIRNTKQSVILITQTKESSCTLDLYKDQCIFPSRLSSCKLQRKLGSKRNTKKAEQIFEKNCCTAKYSFQIFVS